MMQDSRNSGRYRSVGGRRRGGVVLGSAERKRLLQLIISLMLFLIIFVGNGVLPDQMKDTIAQLRTILCADTDFKAAFFQAGEALGKGEPVLNTLGDFCIAVFGPGTMAPPAESAEEPAAPAEGIAYMEGRKRLEQEGELLVSNLVYTQEELFREACSQEEPAPEVLPVGAVVQAAVYNGEALPDQVTMDWLSLGSLDTQSPLQGSLTSTFCYRIHPIDGENKFHYGVDLAAASGASIGAFAAGTVEFIGESEGYGLYLQLDHGNGIKSFYAHCKKICVQKGQTVTMGEKVAEVGDTGNTTGPHLHFQVMTNGKWVDPLYYISSKA